jgi:hypothetical protein
MELLAVARLGVHVHAGPSGELAARQLFMALFQDPERVLHREDFRDFVVVDEKHRSLSKIEKPAAPVYYNETLFVEYRMRDGYSFFYALSRRIDRSGAQRAGPPAGVGERSCGR